MLIYSQMHRRLICVCLPKYFVYFLSVFLSFTYSLAYFILFSFAQIFFTQNLIHFYSRAHANMLSDMVWTARTFVRIQFIIVYKEMCVLLDVAVTNLGLLSHLAMLFSENSVSLRCAVVVLALFSLVLCLSLHISDFNFLFRFRRLAVGGFSLK